MHRLRLASCCPEENRDMAAPSGSSTTAADALTVTLFVHRSTNRVLFAEAGKDAVDFLFSLLATPFGAALGLLLEADPASAADGCFGNLWRAAVTEALVHATSLTPLEPSPASASAAGRDPAGMGIMSKKLFRCDHLGCRCSDVVSRSAGTVCACCGGARATELHFLEAAFYRRPDSQLRRRPGRGHVLPVPRARPAARPGHLRVPLPRHRRARPDLPDVPRPDGQGGEVREGWRRRRLREEAGGGRRWRGGAGGHLRRHERPSRQAHGRRPR